MKCGYFAFLFIAAVLLVACDNTNLRPPSEVEAGWSSSNTQYQYSSPTGISNFIPVSSVAFISSESSGKSSSAPSSSSSAVQHYFTPADFMVTPVIDAAGSTSTNTTLIIAGSITLDIELALGNNFTPGDPVFARARVTPRNFRCAESTLVLTYTYSGVSIPTVNSFSSDATITDGVVEFSLAWPDISTSIYIVSGYCILK